MSETKRERETETDRQTGQIQGVSETDRQIRAVERDMTMACKKFGIDRLPSVNRLKWWKPF